MNILVTTPAGNIGRRVVRELLAPEFAVRVIARDPARLPDEIRGQVEVVHGSLEDAYTLRRALHGVDAMFFCVPAETVQETNVRGHYGRLVRGAAQAIRAAKTPRVVTISGIGEDRAQNAGPISALHTMEDILSESGAAIRHLRCGMFMENLLRQAQAIVEQGVISFPMPGNVAIPIVAMKDVADSALRWLVRRDWSGVAWVTVHGPEDITHNQAAATIERVLERPVRYQEVATNAYVQTLVGRGASVEYAQRLVAMFSELASGIARAEPRACHTTTLTRLSDWAQEELLPLVATQAEAMSCMDCKA